MDENMIEPNSWRCGLVTPEGVTTLSQNVAYHDAIDTVLDHIGEREERGELSLFEAVKATKATDRLKPDQEFRFVFEKSAYFVQLPGDLREPDSVDFRISELEPTTVTETPLVTRHQIDKGLERLRLPTSEPNWDEVDRPSDERVERVLNEAGESERNAVAEADTHDQRVLAELECSRFCGLEIKPQAR